MIERYWKSAFESYIQGDSALYVNPFTTYSWLHGEQQQKNYEHFFARGFYEKLQSLQGQMINTVLNFIVYIYAIRFIPT